MNIVICGGGVIGASVAYFLAERGIAATPRGTRRHRVRGVRQVRGVHRPRLVRRTAAGRACAVELRPARGVGPYPRRGLRVRRIDTLLVAGSDRGGFERYRGMDSPQWLDGRCAVHSAIGSPRTTATIHPERFTRALVDAACASGARLVHGTVEGIARDAGGAVRGVRVDGTDVAADAAVIAMGPWSILAAQWLPLPPVAGAQGLQRGARTARSGSRAGAVRRVRERVGRADLTRNRRPGGRRGVGLRPVLRRPVAGRPGRRDRRRDEVPGDRPHLRGPFRPPRRRRRPPHPGLLPPDLRGRDAAARRGSGRPGRLRRDRPQLLGHAERPGERSRDGRAALRRHVVERRPRAVRSGPGWRRCGSTPPRTGREGGNVERRHQHPVHHVATSSGGTSCPVTAIRTFARPTSTGSRRAASGSPGPTARRRCAGRRGRASTPGATCPRTARWRTRTRSSPGS